MVKSEGKTYLQQWFESINPENIIQELQQLQERNIKENLPNSLHRLAQNDMWWMANQSRGLKFFCLYEGRIREGFMFDFDIIDGELKIKFPGKFSKVSYNWNQVKFIEFVE